MITFLALLVAFGPPVGAMAAAPFPLTGRAGEAAIRVPR